MYRHLLEEKPHSSLKVPEYIGNFFARPRAAIASELVDYLLKIKYEGPLLDELRDEVANATEDTFSVTTKPRSN